MSNNKEVYLANKAKGFWKFREETPELIRKHFPADIAEEYAIAVEKAYNGEKKIEWKQYLMKFLNISFNIYIFILYY